MDLPRAAGLLIHPTQLPGPYGRGDLGAASRELVDLLAGASIAFWQVLPLGPPGYGGSPYAARSAFAGDAALVDLERLVADGLLQRKDLADAPAWEEGAVALESEAWRLERLARAHRTFSRDASEHQRQAFADFRAEQAHWLHDYALYEALKGHCDGKAYWEWRPGLARHMPHALAALRREYAQEIEAHCFAQWQFALDWAAVRGYAATRGVAFLGDLPIFVARDSADAWAQPALFELDEQGEPTVVAGVPPDDFSVDGQRWGNPLYDWKVHARTGFAWWIARTARALELCDWVRIDHFRGFAGYWEVPAQSPTARDGRWVPAPGSALFKALTAALGSLPLVAEDLGVITEDVTALLEETGLPGMKILQFAYYDDEAEHPFRPENYPEQCVVYTGTHDNQTTRGWYDGLDAATRKRAALDAADPVGGLVGRALKSKAALAVIPAQDVLRLGDEARTNRPGEAEGNWLWRLRPGQLDAAALAPLAALNQAHGRALLPVR
ncbi:MAG: 4-alpha-glucanotransferase [Planctomycetota bacterium]